MSRTNFTVYALALTFCYNLLASQPTPPPTVMVAKACSVNQTTPKEYSGLIESIKHVNIMPRVTGILLKTNFDEGSIVEKGALLYELEDTTYLTAVKILEAQQEELKAILNYADTEFKRKDTLLKNKAVSVSIHDQAEKEINVAKAKIEELEASLIDARNTLSYTKIYAPITGRISKSNFTEGNLITPQGGKLAEIDQIAPIYVRFSLSEKLFFKDFGGRNGIIKKAEVQLKLADNTLYDEIGKVTLIDNKINPTTDTITLWATFKNIDNKLIPGGYVTVLLSCKPHRPFVAVVPSSLIVHNGGYYVYILDDDNRVIQQKVKVGNAANGLQTILSGLKGNERIIIDGTHKVKPGIIVNPISEELLKEVK